MIGIWRVGEVIRILGICIIEWGWCGENLYLRLVSCLSYYILRLFVIIRFKIWV